MIKKTMKTKVEKIIRPIEYINANKKTYKTHKIH